MRGHRERRESYLNAKWSGTFDDGSQGKKIERIDEVPVDVGVAILMGDLVVETVDGGDVAALVVASQ